MGNVRVPDTNLLMFAGRLTRDPELKYLTSGKAVCELSIVNSRHYKDAQGNKKEDTVFLDTTLWDKQAEWVAENLKKGRPVLVRGRLKQESWEDKTSGQKRTKMVLWTEHLTPLDWPEDGEQKTGGYDNRDEGNARPAPRPSEREEPIPEDDIPF